MKSRLFPVTQKPEYNFRALQGHSAAVEVRTPNRRIKGVRVRHEVQGAQRRKRAEEDKGRLRESRPREGGGEEGHMFVN